MESLDAGEGLEARGFVQWERTECTVLLVVHPEDAQLALHGACKYCHGLEVLWVGVELLELEFDKVWEQGDSGNDIPIGLRNFTQMWDAQYAQVYGCPDNGREHGHAEGVSNVWIAEGVVPLPPLKR